MIGPNLGPVDVALTSGPFEILGDETANPLEELVGALLGREELLEALVRLALRLPELVEHRGLGSQCHGAGA
jgi:hypothetical protein